MISLYKIQSTSNIEPEQHRHPYTDKHFWPTFQKDMEIFKKKLIECNENNKSILILRMGHAEHCLFNLLVPDKKKGKIIYLLFFLFELIHFYLIIGISQPLNFQVLFQQIHIYVILKH